MPFLTPLMTLIGFELTTQWPWAASNYPLSPVYSLFLCVRFCLYLTEVAVNILLPQTGLYKLMIYLEPESASEEKIYVVSYLLECIKPFSQRLVFQNYGDKLGLQSMRKSKFVSEYYSDLQGSHKQGTTLPQKKKNFQPKSNFVSKSVSQNITQIYQAGIKRALHFG